MDRKYTECDFYQIVSRDGKKYIEINGFYYEAEDYGNGPDRCVQYYDMEYSIEEFIQEVKDKPDSFRDEITDDASGKKQYVSDVNMDIEPYGMYDVPAAELSYEKITAETPIGLYVDF